MTETTTMQASEQLDHSNRSPRYRVNDRMAVHVTVAHTEEESTTCFAELRDFSPGGVQLFVAAAFKTGQSIELRFQNQQHGIDFVIDADVRWTETRGNDGCLIGCSFGQPLADSKINLLVNAGCLQHDDFARHAASGEAKAWKELATEGFTIEIANLSRRGIGVLSPQSAKVGDRLRLQPTTESGGGEPILVRVRFCGETSGKYFLGCQFEKEAAYHRLLDIMNVGTDISTTNESPTSTSPRGVVSRISVLVISLALIGLSFGTGWLIYLLAAVAGIAAFTCLEWLAYRQKQKNKQLWKQSFDQMLENQLESRMSDLRQAWTASKVLN